MMRTDFENYLPGDILTKVDRASMSVSLESRIPFLDRDLVEFALELPLKFKIQRGETKAILRQLLTEYVPKELYERPKMGFGVPLAEWLRGPLKDWAHELLKPEKINRDGYLDGPMVQKYWAEHTKGQREWPHHLWSVLVFQAWKENYL